MGNMMEKKIKFRLLGIYKDKKLIDFLETQFNTKKTMSSTQCSKMIIIPLTLTIIVPIITALSIGELIDNELIENLIKFFIF